MYRPIGGVALTVLVGSTLMMAAAEACTRGVLIGENDTVITLRSMDWMGDIGSNLWVMPRGMDRDGAAGPDSISWTSKYGSVIVTAFDAATADGMNERGLVANLLYLSESTYPETPPVADSKPMSIGVWAQYVLDNFATVDEAVAAMKRQDFYVAPVESPDGHPGTVHLSISDPSGDSAVFEYVDGELTIHHGREYKVMTNSPVYDQQLALDTYWKQIGGLTMLPGTNRAADRFVRTSFYLDVLPKDVDDKTAVAEAFSVIRNASVPLGITTPGKPNISSTLWRSVSDQKNLRYYFESTRSPNVFWLDLDGLDFSEGAPVQRLLLTGGAIYAGNAADRLEPTEAFAFLEATP